MGTKILIVDDSAFMRMTLKNILSKEGYEIAGEAENAEQAVAKYTETKPDLVTMDIIMPGENGIKAVKEIMKVNASAQILMVSAMGQEALIVEAMQAGAKNFIIKPFQPEKVIEAVRKVLKT
ncbi:MAG: response regulator [bacterium]|jgi:two-component system, chemotaxis family, chemotaxis protein CheY|nr:response regulator [bacterium]MDD5260010.1 response regulator [bacterium]MDD5756440.1 response regulator [bacterium]